VDADVARAGAEALIELTGGFGVEGRRATVLFELGVDIDTRCDECVGAVPALVSALHRTYLLLSVRTW
jgi:hypothetical protein